MLQKFTLYYLDFDFKHALDFKSVEFYRLFEKNPTLLFT